MCLSVVIDGVCLSSNKRITYLLTYFCLTVTRISAFAASANLGYISVIIIIIIFFLYFYLFIFEVCVRNSYDGDSETVSELARHTALKR